MNSQDNIPDKMHQFMLAEYNSLRDLRQSMLSLGENRFNFFLASISGAVVGLGLIGQLKINTEIIQFATGVILLGIFFVGQITFVRMVERSIQMAIYRRGMSRIRHYYVENYPSMAKYIIQSTHDDKPAFDSMSFSVGEASSVGLTQVLAVINSIIAGTIIAISANTIVLLPIGWSIVFGSIVFVLIYFYQKRIHDLRVKRMEKSSKEEFPSPNQDEKKIGKKKQ